MMLLGALAGSTEVKAEVGDTLWLDYSDRFVEDQYYALSELDSIAFRKSNMKTFRKSGINAFKSYMDGSLGIYTFEKPDRFIVKPNTYSSNDYSKETSKFCIQRSAESEHFIIFWEKGLNPNAAGNISLGGFSVNVKTLLREDMEMLRRGTRLPHTWQLHYRQGKDRDVHRKPNRLARRR